MFDGFSASLSSNARQLIVEKLRSDICTRKMDICARIQWRKLGCKYIWFVWYLWSFSKFASLKKNPFRLCSFYSFPSHMRFALSNLLVGKKCCRYVKKGPTVWEYSGHLDLSYWDKPKVTQYIDVSTFDSLFFFFLWFLKNFNTCM